MPDIPFTRGLHELSNGTYAWTEPDGTWGYSNSGLVAGDGTSLLIDTLFTVPMTRDMLAGLTEVTDSCPIETVFNTHANGDHWFGNQLVAHAEIIASKPAAEDMPNAGPYSMTRLKTLDGPAGAFARDIFGQFDWSDLVLTPATKSFEGEHSLDVGGVEVRLIEVGPAHTRGDAIAFVPSERVLYTGDMLFIGGTPVVWVGPIQNWIDACDLMADLEPRYVVPGHGPVTDVDGIRSVQRYLQFVKHAATEMFKAGVPPLEAAHRIDLGEFGKWHESGRIVPNVLNVYYELDAAMETVSRDVIYEHLAQLEGY